MKYFGNNIIWTADDEEPNCNVCDNQDCPGRCDCCGSSYAWQYYERAVNGEVTISKDPVRVSGFDNR